MIDNTNDLKGKILGTCMLQELIGRGGMSAVYRAQQLHPARYVAVKILIPNVPIGSQLHQQFLIRFQHEADTIARLDHVNIIPIYEYAEQDGDAYLVMPYLTGGSLHNLLARYGSLSLQETIVYYEDTTYSSIQVNHIMTLSNDRVRVDITDTATEKGQSRPQVYYGYYIVEKENGVWKLDPHFFDK